MAQPTVTQIKNQIVTLCGLISGIATALDDYPEDNEPFTNAELPAIVVRVGAATYEKQSAHRLMVSRTYQIIVHIERITEDVQDPDTAALEAVEPFLLSVATYLSAHPRLDNDDSGLAVSTTLQGDNGPPRIVKEGADYRGTVLNLIVDTLHNT